MSKLAAGASAPVETGTGDVHAEVELGVLTITLSRPEARNALSRAMVEGLALALCTAEARDDVRVVVLTGAGGAFCAGGDVKRMASGVGIFGYPDDPVARTGSQAHWQRETVVRLHDLPKPTIAMIPGPVAGAGLPLALACDLRFASAEATVTTSFGRIGLAGDFGCAWLLTRIAGEAVARDLLYRSQRVEADRAVRLGLFTEVAPAADLLDRVTTAARDLARLSPAAAAAIHRAVRAADGFSFAEACDADARAHVALTGTQEHRDAVAAFVAARGTR